MLLSSNFLSLCLQGAGARQVSKAFWFSVSPSMMRMTPSACFVGEQEWVRV